MLNRIIAICLVSLALSSASFAQKQTLLRIVKAEDERRWDADLRDLFSSSNALVRKRAALAAGRIGEEDAIGPLTNLLEKDADPGVRAMAAFALGEIESEAGANALLALLKNKNDLVELRARAIEALGKIAAALPREKEARQRELGATILEALKSESNTPVVLLGLTAVLRSRPADAGPTLAKFLTNPNARVRADAANALARLRLKDGTEQSRKLLASDLDPVVRANAARLLGIAEDKQSIDALLSRVADDKDLRVRVNAIRALASVKDPRAAEPLLARGQSLRLAELNEILDIATTLGRLLAQKDDQAAIAWLRKLNETLNHTAPEIDLALVRIAPATYLADFGNSDEAKRKVQKTILLNWRAGAGVAAGLGEIAALPETVSNKSELAATAQNLLRAMLDYRNSGLTINTLVAVHSEYAIPDVLRALAAFKPPDLATVARAHLSDSDVIVRSTAADLLGDLPPSEETSRLLIAAWTQAAKDTLNDAALSIIDSLGKQKTDIANDQLKEALKSGATAYFDKPVHLSELKARIRQLLNHTTA